MSPILSARILVGAGSSVLVSFPSMPFATSVGTFHLVCLKIFILPTVAGQLWSISTVDLQVRMKIQLNSILFGKTLVRKDVASASASSDNSKADDTPKSTKQGDDEDEKKDEESDFSSKAQIMTLMTTDVDRVSDFCWHWFALVGMCMMELRLIRPHRCDQIRQLNSSSALYSSTDSLVPLSISTGALRFTDRYHQDHLASSDWQ